MDWRLVIPFSFVVLEIILSVVLVSSELCDQTVLFRGVLPFSSFPHGLLNYPEDLRLQFVHGLEHLL